MSRIDPYGQLAPRALLESLLVTAAHGAQAQVGDRPTVFGMLGGSLLGGLAAGGGGAVALAASVTDTRRIASA